MASILLSFPAGYAIFYIYFGIKSMMLLNFVALFLIMGIGADDAFVLFDTYSQAEAVLGSKSTPVQRMKWAYKEAGSAMLVTTVTTAGSFYANLFSAVRVVKEFGMFMGTVVVWNYINVMIIFPAAILTWEYSCWACKMKFIKKKCCGKKNTNASITPEDTVSGLVRFKMSSGNIDAGTFKLYGVV